MTTHATGSFEGKGWEESAYDEGEGKPKLTHAGVTNAYKGDIEGEGVLEYLMVYLADGSVPFIGLERISGRLGGRTGSFVLQHSGTWENGTARATWAVVQGSGTGELSGLRGSGGYEAAHDASSLTLDYDFA
jgi:hypothetical protein